MDDRSALNGFIEVGGERHTGRFCVRPLCAIVRGPADRRTTEPQNHTPSEVVTNRTAQGSTRRTMKCSMCGGNAAGLDRSVGATLTPDRRHRRSTTTRRRSVTVGAWIRDKPLPVAIPPINNGMVSIWIGPVCRRRGPPWGDAGRCAPGNQLKTVRFRKLTQPPTVIRPRRGDGSI